MMTLTDCTVTGDDTDIEGAVVVVSGDSPNATVRISRPDFAVRKFRLHDRVLNASVKKIRDKWVVEGRSEHLATVVGTSDTTVTFSIETKGECQGCK